MTEEQLAEKVIAWLEQQHWEVYQEVQAFDRGCVADIVATQNNLIWIIEVKVSLSLAVLEQATGWLGFAHFISVAHESKRKTPKGRNVAQNYMRWKGIGELSVQVDMIHELISPHLNRNISAHIKDCLCEEHKTFAKAGNPYGANWTPYQQTCRAVAALVHERPGMYLKELIDHLRHHYCSNQSARSALSKWAQLGRIKGVRTEYDGRYLRFYPVDILRPREKREIQNEMSSL